MRVNALAEAIMAGLILLMHAAVQEYWHDVLIGGGQSYVAVTLKVAHGYVEVQSFQNGGAIVDIFGEGVATYLEVGEYESNIISIGLHSITPEIEQQIVHAPSFVDVLKYLNQLTNGEVADLTEYHILQEKIRQK